MIQITDVSKTYESYDSGEPFYALKEVSLTIEEGETLILLGTSGSGKTTLLKLINRLIQPFSGTIEVDGEDIMCQDPIQLRRKIGYVFQRIGLFPHMTAGENIEIGPRLAGWPQKKRKERVRELLEMMDLDPEVYTGRFPAELSGGQKQRVGVARALAIYPSYLLMDEPFGALDPVTRDGLQQTLISLKERIKKTIIFVTHDIFEALALGDRIAVMHEGKVEQVGSKEELIGEPSTEFVRDLFAKPSEQLNVYENVASSEGVM